MGRNIAALSVALFALTLASSAAASAPIEGVVNINQAAVSQLALLPGIGSSKAERIVVYRAKRPFKKAVELARVKGIGLKTVRRLKPYLRVSGETTLRKASSK